VVLHGCSFVNDWTLHALARHSFNVEHLALDRHADIGPDISDAGLVVLLRGLPQVELKTPDDTKISSKSALIP
jgi:hypothetical protein